MFLFKLNRKLPSNYRNSLHSHMFFLKRYYFNIVIIFCLFLPNICLNAASLPLNIDGDYLVRLPSSSKYIKMPLSNIPDNIIINIPNNIKSSYSILSFKGHKVKLYPGTVFKISKGIFYPMLGRIEFDSDENSENTIDFVANNCNASYIFGHFFIEATPDNGIFFALKNKGSAWVKDSYRKVYELKQGQQVHVPLFGNSTIKNRVESFWGKSPSNYGSLGSVGQESAYGIVGKDYTIKELKTKKEDNNKEIKEKDEKLELEDEEEEEEDKEDENL